MNVAQLSSSFLFSKFIIADFKVIFPASHPTIFLQVYDVLLSSSTCLQLHYFDGLFREINGHLKCLYSLWRHTEKMRHRSTNHSARH